MKDRSGTIAIELQQEVCQIICERDKTIISVK